MFTSPIVGKLTDKYGVNRVFTTMMLLCFVPTLAITHLQAAPLIYTLTLTTLFFVFASGRMIPANTIITASTGIGNRGSFMAIKSALQQLAIGLSALISGHIVFINLDDQYENYNLVGYLAVGLGLSTIYFIRKLRVSKGN